MASGAVTTSPAHGRRIEMAFNFFNPGVQRAALLIFRLCVCVPGNHFIFRLRHRHDGEARLVGWVGWQNQEPTPFRFCVNS
jgi:hypothetical protein